MSLSMIESLGNQRVSGEEIWGGDERTAEETKEEKKWLDMAAEHGTT